MPTIDIGAGAIYRSAYAGFYNQTFIDNNNSANGTGTLTKLQIYLHMRKWSDLIFGTFYGSGTDLACRDFINVGVPYDAGFLEYTDLELDVATADVLGAYNSGDNMVKYDGAGFDGISILGGYHMEDGVQTYNFYPGCAFSFYGEGESVTIGIPQPMWWIL